MFTSSSFVFLLSAAVAMADNHQARNHHAAIAKRINSTSLEKRDTFTGKEMTWYPTDTGPDACTGKNHKDSDFFVAMGFNQFGDGSGCCGKQLRINYNGKSAVAKCVDECATCPEWGQIDLTKGLFEYFTNGDLDIGVIYGSWSYVDGGDDDGPTTTKKTTATHDTTTSTHHTTSTTKEEFAAAPTHTTSSKKHSSSAKPTTSHAEPSSSSVKHSSSAKLSSVILPSFSKPVSPTEDSLPSPPLPSPTDDGGVANVGSAPGSPAGSSDSNTDSGDSGADNISGALTGSTGNGVTSLRSSKFTVAIAALALVAFQAL